jgi:DNA repair protein RecN (Recombination protein N)
MQAKTIASSTNPLVERSDDVLACREERSWSRRTIFDPERDLEQRVSPATNEYRMLRALTIRDFVLFDDLELELGPGLNVISGETGGGKSNLASALTLLGGSRARRDQVRKGASEAVVTGVFEREGRRVEVTRRVAPAGPGRCTIDGRSVKTGVLRETIGTLLSVSGQHEQVSLKDPASHMRVLDEYAGLHELLAAYRDSHDACRDAAARLRRLEQSVDDREYRQHWLEHQIREIRAVQPRPGEDDELEDEIRILANAEKISLSLAEAYSLLYDDEGSAVARTAAASRALTEIARWVPESPDWIQGVDEARALLEETARSMARRLDSVEADPGALQSKQERAYVLQGLKKKHGGSIDAVLHALDEMQRELSSLSDVEGSLSRLEAELSAAVERSLELARALSTARREAAPSLGDRIAAELADLALPEVSFTIRVSPRETGERPLESLDENGIDDVLFLFRPNPGQDHLALFDVASGGELSRVFLAIRALLGATDPDRVLVFDEADTGIGGKVADALGHKLHHISRTQQVLCVTHLAPIAAYADTHILVEKTTAGDSTVSRAVVLDGRDRRDEIARMLGGEHITPKSRAAATELLSLARSRMDDER